jgi:hypothetical protein
MHFHLTICGLLLIFFLILIIHIFQQSQDNDIKEFPHRYNLNKKKFFFFENSLKFNKLSIKK